MALLTRSRSVWIRTIACLLLACAFSCRNEQRAGDRASGSARNGDTSHQVAAAEPAPAVSKGGAPPSEAPAALPTPAGMRRIPQQNFFAGIEPGSHGMEVGRETQAGPMFIDTYEVTVEQYRQCVDAGDCSAPRSRGAGCNYTDHDHAPHPINCVDWYEADRFCRAQHKRLPTSEEWQLAARGTDRRIYPWGNEAPAEQLCWQGRARAKKARTCEVGSFPAGVSPYGVYDMAGNVAEWTATEEPSAAAGRALKAHGGGYVVDPLEDPEWRSVRLDLPTAYVPSYRAPDLGFRCVQEGEGNH